MIIYWSCNKVLHYILEIVDTYFVRACYWCLFSVILFAGRTNHFDNSKTSFLLEQPFPIKKIIVTKQLNIEYLHIKHFNS